jgi:hypothetical protein
VALAKLVSAGFGRWPKEGEPPIHTRKALTMEKRIRILHSPHKSRQRENKFAAFLADRFGSTPVNERFTFDPAALNCLISTPRLLACLDADCCLPTVKRQECIDLVKKLPTQIRVAKEPSRISFDVVVEKDGHAYYWEFHEEQHRSLSVGRASPVYRPNGEELRVPRFLQRLIRDVWRVRTFSDFTIVWCDWFETCQQSYNPIITSGFREKHLRDQFSFKTFCAPYDCR